MPRPPRPERLTRIVRSLAEDSDRVIVGDHARDRMEERDILDVDVFRVLRKGTLKGPIEPGKKFGEWRCKMVERIRGAREVGVVTVVVREQKLFVVTVEWEDLR